MRLRPAVFSAFICFAANTAAAQTAPPSSDVAAAQALATLNAANIANSNAKATADLSALKAIQEASAGGGQGGGADYGNTAEALLVSHFSMNGAAHKLAVQLKNLTSHRVLIVWGSSPPPIGPYFQFLHDRDILDEQLTNALADWQVASAGLKAAAPAGVGKGKKGGKKPRVGGGAPAGQAIVNAGLGAAAASNPAGLAITAALTLASVGRIDTTVNGVAITSDQEQCKEIVLAALQDSSVNLDFTEFDLPSYPSELNLGLSQLITDEQAASKAYRQNYLTLLASAGVATKLPAAVVAVGTELSTAVTAADAFRKSAYASTNGVSAASGLITAERLLESRGSAAILFLRSMKTAATVRGNKGFFVGITRSPSDFEAATSIDYLLMEPTALGATTNPNLPQSVKSGAAVFYSGLVHLWRVNNFLKNYPDAGSGPMTPNTGDMTKEKASNKE